MERFFNIAGPCALAKRFIEGFALIVSVVAWAAAPDCRPKFDKRDYAGSIAVQVNPWFPFDKQPGLAYGGPNRAWRHYEGRDVWAQGMQTVAAYGVTTWMPEINEPTTHLWQWREMLRQAETNQAPIRLGLFYGLYSPTADATLDELKKQLLPLRDVLTNSPCVARAGGCPVMLIYNPFKLKPEAWGAFPSRVDAEITPMRYLLDAPSLAVQAERDPGPQDPAAVDARFERHLRAYLPYFDGVSGYANGCRMSQPVIRRVMDDYPQKIFEGVMHFTYTVHFHMGGNDVRLSRNWRKSVEACLAADPDAIMLTNLFDHYENSLVLPCCDREDFVLRYLECRVAKWRGKPFRRLSSPELVVTGNYVAQLGVTPLEFEVIGFPTAHAEKSVTLHLDVCDTSGRVLHTFPARGMTLDGEAKVETFSVPSLDYARERGVVARLRYDWSGRTHTMNFCPMTLIDPALRGYRLYWARSTKNELAVRGDGTWTIDGVGAGGTHAPRTSGMSVVCGRTLPCWQHGEKWRNGQSRFTLRRDGEEYLSRSEAEGGLSWARRVALPPPGGALHWYNLEMENDAASKFMTLPIWETDGSRARMVRMNVPNGTNGVVAVEVEEARVPCWDYPMAEDGGGLLVDASGWEHHGALRGKGFGGGHLGHTGYNHLHSGVIAPFAAGDSPMLRRAPEGTGYLTFDGSNDYVTVMGGTAFPGAGTYELRVRPRVYGREMGLLGSANGQIAIDMLSNGTVRVSRKSPAGVKSVVTKDPLPIGAWTRLAAVYDLRRLTVYWNGRPAGSVEVPWMEGLDFYNNMTIGAKCQPPWTPVAFFTGDIAHVRMTGRDLGPGDLLR